MLKYISYIHRQNKEINTKIKLFVKKATYAFLIIQPQRELHFGCKGESCSACWDRTVGIWDLHSGLSVQRLAQSSKVIPGSSGRRLTFQDFRTSSLPSDRWKSFSALRNAVKTHQKDALVILPLWTDLVIKKIKLKHPKPKRNHFFFLVTEVIRWKQCHEKCLQCMFKTCHSTMSEKATTFFGMLLVNSKLFEPV